MTGTLNKSDEINSSRYDVFIQRSSSKQIGLCMVCFMTDFDRRPRSPGC